MNEEARPLYTYFGIRESGETMWGLEKLPILPYEISGAVNNDWRDIAEWSLIGEFEEQERLDKAMRDERPPGFVWIINPRIKEWNKWDVPVGLVDTRQRICDIAWKVIWFRHNRVKLELRVEEEAIIVWGDELLCDPFPQLCLLASHVEQGRESTISLENGWSYFYEFHVRNTDDHNIVFFMARAHGALDGDSCEFLYLRVERERFVAALRAMLEEVADHPDLIHHYLMDISDDDALDKAEERAAEAWKVIKGGCADDMEDDDLYIQIENRFVREIVPVSRWILPSAKQYMEMLLGEVVWEIDGGRRAG